MNNAAPGLGSGVNILLVIYFFAAMDALSGILGEGLWLQTANPTAVRARGIDNVPTT